MRCTECGEDFLPDSSEEDVCPACQFEMAFGPDNADEAGPVTVGPIVSPSPYEVDDRYEPDEDEDDDDPDESDF